MQCSDRPRDYAAILARGARAKSEIQLGCRKRLHKGVKFSYPDGYNALDKKRIWHMHFKRDGL